MRVHVLDQAPAAGPSRTTYLESRIRRCLVPYDGLIDSASLTVGVVDGKHDVMLTITPAVGPVWTIEAANFRMVTALSRAFEAMLLRVDARFPGRALREEAS